MDLKTLEAMASEEFARHGLLGWTFQLSNSKRRLGVCKYQPKRIEIGEYYARNNPDEAVRDTLLHEIAHAIAGHEAGHGPAWKEVAIRLGATPRACESAPETIVPPGDWRTTCPACQKTHHRYKRPRSLTGYRCRCAARSPLVFEYSGDPALAPPVPRTIEEAARWQAKCQVCGVVHKRSSKPRAGLWRCRCARNSQLIWEFVSLPNPGS